MKLFCLKSSLQNPPSFPKESGFAKSHFCSPRNATPLWHSSFQQVSAREPRAWNSGDGTAGMAAGEEQEARVKMARIITISLGAGQVVLCCYT